MNHLTDVMSWIMVAYVAFAVVCALLMTGFLISVFCGVPSYRRAHREVAGYRDSWLQEHDPTVSGL